ncbi:MAG: hypothetical protein K6A41_06675 [Bacteroidales bacterium]|nr:hypothetical protein [Bacteroidales bacterium]
MKYRLLFVIFCFCATSMTAQHITLKNYQKKVHPGLTAITTELYSDKDQIANVDWLEYLDWLEQIYGKESDEYRSALPDKQALRQLLPDSLAEVYANHPAYRYSPVLGVSPTQARAYCEWRTDRVAEQMLVSLGRLEYDSNQTPENYFSVKKGMMPADLKTLYFFLPDGNIETWYGFSCFAEWR